MEIPAYDNIDLQKESLLSMPQCGNSILGSILGIFFLAENRADIHLSFNIWISSPTMIYNITDNTSIYMYW